MGFYANGHEDMLIRLSSRCVTFSEAHKDVSSPVKLKTLGRSFFESLPVVWCYLHNIFADEYFTPAKQNACLLIITEWS